MYKAIVDRCRGNRTTQGKEKLAELHHNEHEEKAKKLVSTERKKEKAFHTHPVHNHKPLWPLESRAGRQPIETTPPLSTDEVVEGARHEACIYPAVSPPSIGANC